VDQVTHSLGRALFVGDAAAATDPLTGEGIGQALATGTWAAEAILAGAADRAGSVRARYERTVRDELVADHRMAELLSRAMSHRKGVRVAVRLAGSTAWTRRNFARWLFEDYPCPSSPRPPARRDVHRPGVPGPAGHGRTDHPDERTGD
jgi:flavin-dependent dehydrogenase